MNLIESRIYIAMVGNEDGLFSIDVIDYESGLWLVPEWLDNKAQGWTTPARIIRLDTIPHQRVEGQNYHFVVNVSIPKALLQGCDPSKVTTECPLEIRDMPEVRISPTSH